MTTVPDAELGGRLADGLVNERLAACVQILPPMTSVYVWEGAVQNEPEHLLLIKTTDEKWPEVRDYISRHHSYDVPEIVALRASAVSQPYANWLTATLR